MTLKILQKKLNKTFIDDIRRLSGQNVFQCIQCGNCSASCPMTDDMDVFPRRAVRMIQFGMQEKLERLNIHWICASCQNCGVVCPRGIDLPRVMEALRLMTLRQNINYLEPSQLPPEILRECPQIALVAAFRKSTS